MTTSTNSTPHVVVVVLGDVGRSPRMQYHARSLLEQGYDVSLVGYEGEDLIPDLRHYEERQEGRGNNNGSDNDVEESYLNVVRFTPYCPPTWLKQYKLKGKIPIGLPVYLLMRLIGLLFGLVYALWFRVPVRKECKSPMPAVQCILVQNPPSIPLLFISYIYCITHAKMEKMTSYPSSPSSHDSKKHREKQKYRLTRPGFIIDWHNLGYTMFDTSPNHPIKKIAKLYEQMLAPLSDGNLCVTDAMKEYLVTNFHIRDEKRISVLHDRPPEFFKPTSLETKHELMMKLRNEMESLCPILKEKRLQYDQYGEEENEESTVFTKMIRCSSGAKVIIPQENQPVLLISSTSWTPDEDFSILLDALVNLGSKVETYKNYIGAISNYPHFIVIVTGKGPQKAMYQAKIKELILPHVSIITMWMEAEDYPILLGCADVGISLHLSTSNLDLPMKIYDFFGCEVPVCAVGFPCLHELVQDDENGRIFDTGEELSSQLFNLCCGKGRNEEDNKLTGELSCYRSNIRDISRWRENWVSNAHDMIKSSFPSSDDRDEETSKVKSD